jgi:hypothetical protein
MKSIRSSGEGLSIADNVNESSCDSNPYAYPYIYSNGTSPPMCNLVVKFASLWNEVAADSDSVRGKLKHLSKTYSSGVMRTPWKHPGQTLAAIPLFIDSVK